MVHFSSLDFFDNVEFISEKLQTRSISEQKINVEIGTLANHIFQFQHAYLLKFE